MTVRRGALATIALLAVGAGTLAFTASLRQSATFDEIVLVAGGARAIAHDRWDMIVDQPPLPLWLYGMAAGVGRDELPPEDRDWGFEDRWAYAQTYVFGGGDPQARLQGPRAVSSAMVGLLVVVTGGFAWWAAGPVAAGLASWLMAFTPDVLAHGGVAYNDLPLALAFLLAVWALDAAVRGPSLGRGALAGAAVATALGMKLSAVALLPVSVLLLVAEAVRRGADPGWGRSVAQSVGVAILAAYAVLVVLYRGDLTLGLLRYSFIRTAFQTSGGFASPAYLLGEVRTGGWWYYFPFVFFLKTSAAFHGLLLVALMALLERWRKTGAGFARALAWRGRAPLLAILVFGLFLVRADLNGGFRYALPVLPLLTVTMAIGLAHMLSRPSPAMRSAVVSLLVLQALSVLSFHPSYLAYSSVWAGGRNEAWRSVADSNIDWGQGLLELRAFMEEEDVSTVRLSYFGSAIPAAYGIDYVALPSFFRLTPERTPDAEANPRFTAISATNLVGVHMQGRDPFAAYRERVPYRVLGHAMLVFDDEPSSQPGSPPR